MGQVNTKSERSYILSEEEILKIYGLDIMTAEVIRHGLINATSQMAWNLTYSAFSSVVRDLQDFAVGISSPLIKDKGLNLDLLASAEGCAIHFFTFQYKARNNIIEYGLHRLEPGDVLLYNDPYRGGSHVMDIGCSKPVFHDGEIIAFTCTDAHWADIGGPVAGGFGPGFAKDMYSEGMRLSPRLLYSKGERVKETFDLFLDNTRIPNVSLNDLQAKAATLAVGERRILSLVQKYGKEALLNAMRYILDYGERRMRAAIAEVPDGDYKGEDPIDDDGVTKEQYWVKSKLSIRGDKAEVDLSGSSRQAIGNITGLPSDVASAGHIAIKSIVLPDFPSNAGMFRPIDLVIPPQCIAHALPPASNTQGHLSPTTKLLTSIQQSLADALPERVVGECCDDVPTMAFYGWDNRATPRQPFMAFEVPFGPYGGTSAHDGLSYSLHLMGNCIELSYEILEEFYPLLVTRKEFVRDTAGPGKYRGGPATRWDQMTLVDAVISAAFDHVRVKTKGILGGKGGHPALLGVVSPDKWDVVALKSNVPASGGWTPASCMEIVSGYVNPETGALDYEKGEYRSGRWSNRPLPAGSVFVAQVAGGGGYGDPLERDPQLVWKDVRDDLVSIEAARHDYGVVISPETLGLNDKATRKLRTQLKASRR